MLGVYLPAILTLVGITNTQQQLGINIGLSVCGFVFGLAGAMIVDRVKRRSLLISTMAVFVFFLSVMAVTGGLFANGISRSAVGIVSIAFIFLFNCSSAFLGNYPISNLAPVPINL